MIKIVSPLTGGGFRRFSMWRGHRGQRSWTKSLQCLRTYYRAKVGVEAEEYSISTTFRKRPKCVRKKSTEEGRERLNQEVNEKTRPFVT